MPNISTPLSYGEGFELNRSSWQATGLTGWWPLGIGQGVRDFSLYGHHGVMLNGNGLVPWSGAFTSAEQRRGLDFAGSVNGGTNCFYARTTAGVPAAMEVTFSAWLRIPDDNAAFMIATLTRQYTGGDGRNLNIYCSSSSSQARLIFNWDDDAGNGFYATSQPPYTDDSFMLFDEWALYTFVRRGVAGAWYIDFYRNGDLYTSMGSYSANPSTNSDLKMYFNAYRDNGLNSPGTARMDDVRLYNRSMGANEVKAMYLDTKDGGYGDLAASTNKFYPPLTTSAAAPSVPAATHKQIDLVEGPSSEFDVITELRDEHRGATGRGAFCPVGVVNESAFGTRIAPSTQAGLNRLDNRFVRGVNQGDPIA